MLRRSCIEGTRWQEAVRAEKCFLKSDSGSRPGKHGAHGRQITESMPCARRQVSTMSETYTGVCTGTVQSTFQSCAQRIDSLRQDCTKSYATLTDWPGPCECTYYSQDMMCFDQQELCASQVWSQVPSWFRDGVTTCLAKDASYTVRAQLGTYQNPFTVTGLAGSLATSTANPGSTATQNGAAATAGTAHEQGTRWRGGAVAGVVVGGVAALILLLLALWLMLRQRKKAAPSQTEPENAESPPELQGDAGAYEKEGQEIFEPRSKHVYESPGWEGNELPSKEPVELFAGDAGVEMSHEPGVHGELPSSPVDSTQAKAG